MTEQKLNDEHQTWGSTSIRDNRSLSSGPLSMDRVCVVVIDPMEERYALFIFFLLSLPHALLFPRLSFGRGPVESRSWLDLRGHEAAALSLPIRRWSRIV